MLTVDDVLAGIRASLGGMEADRGVRELRQARRMRLKYGAGGRVRETKLDARENRLRARRATARSDAFMQVYRAEMRRRRR